MKRSAVYSVVVVALLCGIYLIGRGRTSLTPVVAPPARLIEPSSNDVATDVPATLEEEPAAVETPPPTEIVPDTVYVSGLVVDSDGHPAPESLVDAKWTTGSDSVIADEEGRFALPIPRNTLRDGALVIVRKVSYQGRVYDVPFRGEVHDDQLTGYLDSRLGQFPVSGGRAGAGEGALGAWDTVTTYNGGDYAGRLTIQEGPDGSITGAWEDELGPPELTRLVVPETITLSAAFEGYRAFPESYDVPPAGRDDVTLIMVATASVDGLVIDSEGVPLPGWRVVARGEGRYAQTDTEDSGAFTLAGMAPGEYEVFANYPQNSSMRTEAPSEVVVRPGEHVRGLTLVYNLGQLLAGYVSDSNGQPIQNAQITSWLTQQPASSDGSLTSFSAESGAAGRYVISGIPETQGIQVNLQIWHSNYMQASRYSVVVDGADQDFTLFETPTIEGRVLDAATRAPIDEFRLFSWMGDSNQEYDILAAAGRRTLESHPEGEFSFRPRGFDRVQVAISAPGYATGLHRLEGVRPGETVIDIEILLEPIAPLTGSVVSSDGSPVRDARIFLGYPLMVGNTSGIMGSGGLTQTDSAGAFVITEFPESLSVVSAYHPDYAPSWTNVATPSSPIEIVLPQGGRLEGIVTYGGVPLENRRSIVNIQSQESDSASMQAFTGDGGHYSIERVFAGPLTISAGFHEGGLRRYIHRDINLQSGETIHQDFDFGDAYDSYVEGTLLLDDRPVPLSLLRGEIEFENGDRVFYQTATTGDGVYRLGPIPAAVFEFGAIWILLEDGSYLEPPSETVTTRPGETTHHDIILVTD